MNIGAADLCWPFLHAKIRELADGNKPALRIGDLEIGDFIEGVAIPLAIAVIQPKAIRTEAGLGARRAVMGFGVLQKVNDRLWGRIFVPHSGRRQIVMRSWCYVRTAAEAVIDSCARSGRRLRISIRQHGRGLLRDE